MFRYVVLTTFTDQGIRNVKDTVKRADAAREAASRLGVDMRELYWTQGQYDLVALCEAKDENAALAFGLSLGASGNVRSQTLRAFSRDEMSAIVAKLP